MAKYLAKWNSSSFPAPTDKNPKKVEEFIKQVLVDKNFYSETPVEQTEPKFEAVGSRSLKSQRSIGSTSQPSWKAFSEESNVPKLQQSVSSASGNWAEFPSAFPLRKQSHPVDPFSAGSPPNVSSPKSVKSTPADPFSSQQAWDPFTESMKKLPQPSATIQSDWKQFEVKKEAKPDKSAEAQNGAAKPKPAMAPLPEEWFSVDAPSTQPFSYAGDAQSFQSVQTSGFPQGGGFPSSLNSGNHIPGTPQSVPYGYSPQAARASLGTFSSFRSVPGNPQPWQQQPQQNLAYAQPQDSMASYVSHRVDAATHHHAFQNLDMDMRAKAHSVAGVPVQSVPHGLFQSPGTGTTAFNAPNFQQTFMQTPPSAGFDEPSGNPFA